MRSINLHEAKTHLSEIVSAAAAGEEIIIARSGVPMARLVPLEKPAPRRPGIAKGRLTDAFFEPLPEDELHAWEA
ncbi:MAG: type II toxin-antitoxin system prevent-host-death family antitoxin [Sulfuricellaceae bacterium]